MKLQNFGGISSSVPSTHNHDARRLQRVKQESDDVEKQEYIRIMVESIWKCVSGMSNQKDSGPDDMQGFWFKMTANLQDRLAKRLEACLNTATVP